MRVSIALLSYDHGIIRQVLDVLGEALKEDRQPAFMAEVVEISAFLTDFIDRFHHRKEEVYLFPLAAIRVPELTPILPDLVSDHAKARGLLEAMNASIGQGGALGGFSASAASLITHMTAHIDREERSVFGMIEAAITREDDRSLSRSMNEFSNAFRPAYYRVAEEFSKRIQDRVMGPGYFSKVKNGDETD